MLFDSFTQCCCFYYYWIDINECDLNNGGCHQICVNKQGAPNVCLCKRGYIPHPRDSSRCIGRNDAYSLWHSFKKLLMIPPKQKSAKYHYFETDYSTNPEGIELSHRLQLINEGSSQ